MAASRSFQLEIGEGLKKSSKRASGSSRERRNRSEAPEVRSLPGETASAMFTRCIQRSPVSIRPPFPLLAFAVSPFLLVVEAAVLGVVTIHAGIKKRQV